MVERRKEQQDQRREDREEGLQSLQEGCSSVKETFSFSFSLSLSFVLSFEEKEDRWVMQEMVKNSTPSPKEYRAV